jgi:hypothetical protein
LVSGFHRHAQDVLLVDNDPVLGVIVAEGFGKMLAELESACQKSNLGQVAETFGIEFMFGWQPPANRPGFIRHNGK